MNRFWIRPIRRINWKQIIAKLKSLFRKTSKAALEFQTRVRKRMVHFVLEEMVSDTMTRIIDLRQEKT